MDNRGASTQGRNNPTRMYLACCCRGARVLRERRHHHGAVDAIFSAFLHSVFPKTHTETTALHKTQAGAGREEAAAAGFVVFGLPRSLFGACKSPALRCLRKDHPPCVPHPAFRNNPKPLATGDIPKTSTCTRTTDARIMYSHVLPSSLLFPTPNTASTLPRKMASAAKTTTSTPGSGVFLAWAIHFYAWFLGR